LCTEVWSLLKNGVKWIGTAAGKSMKHYNGGNNPFTPSTLSGGEKTEFFVTGNNQRIDTVQLLRSWENRWSIMANFNFCKDSNFRLKLAKFWLKSGKSVLFFRRSKTTVSAVFGCHALNSYVLPFFHIFENSTKRGNVP